MTESPLLISRDPSLLADLRRLAAAAGASLDVASSADDARGRWSGVPLVLVGADLLDDLAATRPVRRDRVHVVSDGRCGDHLFRSALAVGAETVVELPAAEEWLVEVLTDTADGAEGAGPVVAVVGGSGGAGATTFAAALATVAADVPPVTLVDADPLGPGLEGVAGVTETDGAGWASVSESAGRLGSRALRGALPVRDGLAVLGWGTGPRVALEATVVREALSAARRGSRLVVVDLPRYLDAAATEALVRCDRALVVTGLDVASVGATARQVAGLLRLAPWVGLVARGPASALDPDEVAAALGVPLVAVMADQRRLAESIDLGLGPLRTRRGPLARAARDALAVVGPAGVPGARAGNGRSRRRRAA